MSKTIYLSREKVSILNINVDNEINRTKARESNVMNVRALAHI